MDMVCVADRNSCQRWAEPTPRRSACASISKGDEIEHDGAKSSAPWWTSTAQSATLRASSSADVLVVSTRSSVTRRPPTAPQLAGSRRVTTLGRRAEDASAADHADGNASCMSPSARHDSTMRSNAASALAERDAGMRATMRGAGSSMHLLPCSGRRDFPVLDLPNLLPLRLAT